ncbi:MAG TPA: cell division protein FtsZ, partial [Ghiorsea sp.]|nr:cell division protein FtsZ [Ghiorsea sp.]
YNMVDEEANVNCGVVFDEDAGEELRVTVVATGLQKQEVAKLAPVRSLHQPKMPVMGDVPVPGFVSGTGQAQAQTATVESPYDDLYDVPTWIRQQAD